jgi:glycosyltransferase involved in cell wall biosynthesis
MSTPKGSLGPRVAIGIPLYNPGPHFSEAVESLLSQTFRDVAFVLVDDSDDAAAADLPQRYAEVDPRVTYRRNDRRLGLTRNWKRAVDLALAIHPGVEYFAWGSDHDVWHPRWLGVLVEELDRRPEASVAYSRSAVIREGRDPSPRPPCIETVSLSSAAEKLRLLSTSMRAGHMIYGLFRAETVRRAGGFRHVLYADRLLLTEAALYGGLVEVDEVLYYKRQTGKFSLERQRAACFPDGVPPYARLPWWLTHAGALAISLGVRGTGAPRLPRREAPGIAMRYAAYNGQVALKSRLAARSRAAR